MAIFSLLVSFLGKKLGDIVQAIFGWSVTALFGRLSGKKEIAISIALLLSIGWPVFVVGLFFPGVAAWVLAFLPVQHWISSNVLRIVWGALAFLAPLLVGALTRWAAPQAKGGVFRSLINGYPLALGYLVAFLVTVVTVPVVKISSALRGWADEHVYLQPRPNRYDAVLHELAEACARAGMMPEITEVPVSMSLSTRALKTLARGMVEPIVAEEVRCVRAKDLELYLYPADLLLRGDAHKVARVRAMLSRTEIDADAYLVGSDRGQELQDDLGRLIETVGRHEQQGFTVGEAATRRLIGIWHELKESKIPYDEWVTLESIARRVERRLAGVEHFPLDREADDLEKVAKEAHAELSAAE
ncbi:MAG: hypothetical protein JWP97_3189 [Labilithrix sp.]|nr:hypothetical protein [Labilithrix sp.]